MCNTCVTNARLPRSKVTNPLKLDPTRSLYLRKKMMADVGRRFFRIRTKINKLVLEEDAFGLKSVFKSRSPSQFQTNTRWEFETSEEQVKEFQGWLAKELDDELGEEEYWEKYVEEGFKKGQGKAFTQTKKTVFPRDEKVESFYEGTKNEFLRSAFGRPVAISKVKVLAGRVFTELKGVSDQAKKEISRELVDGLTQGKNPNEIARGMSKRIGIARNRARTIARTEIIRAHAEGQLDAFEELGVEKVGVAVEWSTAGDDRVCDLCAPMDGVVLSLREARGLIPRHPNCRCAFVPANVGESTVGQKRTKLQVRKAMNDSIVAEGPKKKEDEIGVKDSKQKSKWKGADTPISKDRPASPFTKTGKPKAPTKKEVAKETPVKKTSKPKQADKLVEVKPKSTKLATATTTPGTKKKATKATPIPKPVKKPKPVVEPKTKPVTKPKPKRTLQDTKFHPAGKDRIHTVPHQDTDKVVAQSRKQLKRSTNDQREALHEYSSSSDQVINNAMRDRVPLDNDFEYVQEVRIIDSTIKKYGTTVEEITYRGMDLWEDDEKKKLVNLYQKALDSGGTVADRAYFSTSKSPSIALDFASSQTESVILEIQGKGALNMSSSSFLPEEQEMLYPRNTKLQPTEITTEKYGGKLFTVIKAVVVQ